MLDMWAYDQERSAKREQEIPGNVVSRPATLRKALWWWKVHCATGELREDRIELEDMTRTDFVWATAEVFWLADWYKSSVGIDNDTSGNWAYLAYKPWQNIWRRDAYNIALKETRIKPRLNAWVVYDENGDLLDMGLAPDGQRFRLTFIQPPGEGGAEPPDLDTLDLQT